MREVAARARPDVALANHLVMGPLILARALAGTGVPYAVKIHGSALEYTVKPHPRFLPAAREGLAPARGRARRVAPHGGEPVGRAGRARAWRTRPASARRASTSAASRRASRRRPRRASSGCAPRSRSGGRRQAAPRRRRAAALSSFSRSAAEAAAALGELDPRRDRIVLFIGKLIASKGVELLLAAWPLVLARAPDARLLIVGFGAFRDAAAGARGALSRGDLDAARALRAEDGRELPELAAFLDALGAEAAAYRAAADGMAASVHWAGRLEHDELVDVIPAAEALAMPSTFPEAFGMVAAEAAAGGALPVVAGHSGMAEVADALAAAVPPEVRPVAHVRGRPARGDAAGRGAGLLARRARRPARPHARRDRRRRARALLVGRRRPHRDRRRRGAAGRPSAPLSARSPPAPGTARAAPPAR